MKKIVITFGLISGAILGAMVAFMIPLAIRGLISFDYTEIIGYSTMVLAFLLVFFGIRSYRDNVKGGAITFGQAFKVGILITLIACAVYVITWEIVYFNFIPDFAERYGAFTIDKVRARGASAAEIAAEQQKMAKFAELYKNPLFNVGMTFLEAFPVGLIVTLVSALILRRRATPDAPSAAAAAA